jgi:hypothetical protein
MPEAEQGSRGERFQSVNAECAQMIAPFADLKLPTLAERRVVSQAERWQDRRRTTQYSTHHKNGQRLAGYGDYSPRIPTSAFPVGIPVKVNA